MATQTLASPKTLSVPPQPPIHSNHDLPHDPDASDPPEHNPHATFIEVTAFNRRLSISEAEHERAIACTRNLTRTVNAILAKLLINGKQFMTTTEIRDEVARMGGGSFTDDAKTFILDRVSARCSQLYAAGKLYRTAKRISNMFGYYANRQLSVETEALDPDAHAAHHAQVAVAVGKKGREVEDAIKLMARCNLRQALDIQLEVTSTIERLCNQISEEHTATVEKAKTMERTILQFRKLSAALE